MLSIYAESRTALITEFHRGKICMEVFLLNALVDFNINHPNIFAATAVHC